MRSKRQSQPVWACLHGAELAGLSEHAVLFQMGEQDVRDVWVPLRHLQMIRYILRGEDLKIYQTEQVDAVRIPRWMADRLMLDYEEEGEQ